MSSNNNSENPSNDTGDNSENPEITNSAEETNSSEDSNNTNNTEETNSSENTEITNSSEDSNTTPEDEEREQANQELQWLLTEKPSNYDFLVEEIIRTRASGITPYKLLIVAIYLMNKTENRVAIRITKTEVLDISLDTILCTPIDPNTLEANTLISSIQTCQFISSQYKDLILSHFISLLVIIDSRFIVDQDITDKSFSTVVKLEDIYLFKDDNMVELKEVNLYLKKDFGITNSSTITSVINKIQGVALRHLEKVKILKTKFEYSRENRALYFLSGRNYYLLDGVSITKYNSGENDIFVNHFETKDFDFDANDLMTPSELHGVINVPDFATDSALLQIICGRTNFEPSYTADFRKQQIQQTFYLFSLFFPELIRTKPIMIIDGDMNSGKTMLFEIYRKIIANPDAQLQATSMNSDRDIESAIVKYGESKLVIFDNLIKVSEAMEEMLVLASTGGEKDLRVAYARTKRPYDLRASTVLTTRHAHDLSRKSDLIDRALIARYTAYATSTVTEGEILSPAYDGYDKIKSELFLFLNKIMYEINNNLDNINLTKDTTSRFKDYLKINKVVAKVLGIDDDEFYEYVKVVESTAIQFNLDNKPILSSLVELVDHFRNGNPGIVYDPNNLTSAIMLKIMQQEDIDNHGYKERGLTRTMKELKLAVEKIGIVMNPRTNRQKGAVSFKIIINEDGVYES